MNRTQRPSGRLNGSRGWRKYSLIRRGPSLEVQAHKPITAVVIGDLHFPFEDPAAMALAKKIIASANPEIVIINGDLVDFFGISRFPVPRSGAHSLLKRSNTPKRTSRGCESGRPTPCGCTTRAITSFVFSSISGAARQSYRNCFSSKRSLSCQSWGSSISSSRKSHRFARSSLPRKSSWESSMSHTDIF
jgi:hypothetical protein